MATERNLTHVESPRRIQRTRGASREDAIASTRQLFASVSKQNRVTMMKLPAETTTDVPGRNTMNVNIPVTSATPIVTEAETIETETGLGLFFLIDPLLDQLQQLLVDHKHGYNVFWRGK